MRSGAPGHQAPSALCSLTEQMHLHKYVQRIFADATGKRKVHADGDFASEYERPPSAARTPDQQEVRQTSSGYACQPRGGALRSLLAAERPLLALHDGPVFGPDQHEPGE